MGNDLEAYKFMYKNGGVDLRNFFDQQKFEEIYAFQDKEKDERLQNIKKEEKKIQLGGFLLSTPILGASIYKRNFSFLLPCIAIITISKYYAIQHYNQLMSAEPGIKSYWLKSLKFRSDLNKVEHFIRERDQVADGKKGTK